MSLWTNCENQSVILLKDYLQSRQLWNWTNRNTILLFDSFITITLKLYKLRITIQTKATIMSLHQPSVILNPTGIKSVDQFIIFEEQKIRISIETKHHGCTLIQGLDGRQVKSNKNQKSGLRRADTETWIYLQKITYLRIFFCFFF